MFSDNFLILSDKKFPPRVPKKTASAKVAPENKLIAVCILVIFSILYEA